MTFYCIQLIFGFRVLLQWSVQVLPENMDLGLIANELWCDLATVGMQMDFLADQIAEENRRKQKTSSNFG